MVSQFLPLCNTVVPRDEKNIPYGNPYDTLLIHRGNSKLVKWRQFEFLVPTRDYLLSQLYHFDELNAPIPVNGVYIEHAVGLDG